MRLKIEIPPVYRILLVSCFLGACAPSGDRARALVLMMDIRESLIRWQRLDLEVEKFISASYFSLFLVFTSFIAAVSLAVWFLHRVLERSRIAGELHDTVAQDLRYLALRVAKIGRTAAAAEREDLCREVAAAQEKLMGRIRDICDGLAPPDFRFQGLPHALRRIESEAGEGTIVYLEAPLEALPREATHE
jgi:signal transduction histidine kinase